jgi:zinc protease
MTEHAASHVWSGWLNNNVRVHFKKIDTRKDQVSISIALIGGEMLETAENRGITAAAQLAWSKPATTTLSSSDIRSLMTGKKVSVRGGGGFGGGRGGGGRRGGGGGGGGGSDAITLSISGSPAELEPGFQLAYLLLTEPKIEQTAFDTYKTNAMEMLSESQNNPMMLGTRTAGSIIYPESETKLQPVKAEQIEKITLDGAQKWLKTLIATSPIEVSIVGDIEKDQVMPLVQKYLGSLATREKVSPSLFAAQRHVVRPAGPRSFSKAVDTPTDQAFVMSGFYGADESNRPDARALAMAARILSTRMVKEVREEAQLVYSIGAASRAATTYPGFGVFAASAPTDPHKVDALLAKLTEMYSTFAAKGPTEEEVEVAKKQMAKTFEEQQTEPAYWSGRLDQMTFRHGDMDQFLAEPAEYQKLTAKQIQETFAKYYSKETSITVAVKPQGETGKQ